MVSVDKEQISKTINATAPYNFISLNSKVLEPDVSAEFIAAATNAKEDKSFYGKEMARRELLSGYFDLTVVNQTPLFVGMGTKEGTFFNDGLNVCIPGSSLRGCIKNLYKIITFSSFRAAEQKDSQQAFEYADVYDEKMYYRAIGSPNSARITDAYKKAVPAKMRKEADDNALYSKSEIHTALLVKQNEEYALYPTKGELITVSKEDMAIYGKVFWKNDSIYVKTGEMNQYYKLFSPNFSQPLPIEKKPKFKANTAYEILKNAYQKDSSRTDIAIMNINEFGQYIADNEFICLKNGYAMTGGADLLHDIPDASYAVPCFYVTNATGTKVKKFGPGPYLTKKIYEPQYTAKAGFVVRKGREYYLAEASLKVHKFDPDEKLIADKIVWENTRVLVYTGEIAGKTHYYAITAPNFNKLKSLTDNGQDRPVLVTYKNDANRNGLWLINSNISEKTENVEQENLEKGFAMSSKSGQEMLRNTTDLDYVIPCFYLEGENGMTVKYISANPLPRVAYEYSPANHIPRPLKTKNPDFTDMVFGFSNLWSSRLSFENMYLAKDSKEEYAYNPNNNLVKPLLGAKPTAGQFYLDEYDTNTAATWDDLESKDGGAVNIRGYKMYWHRKPDWIFEDSDKKGESKINYDILPRMKPLKEGRKFTGRIHFSGIDAYELGALAYLFKMCGEDDCCLKLGGGAPLGLGSVQVTAKLYVDSKEFYSSLFEGDNFAAPKQEDLEKYSCIFKDYVSKKLGNNTEFNSCMESLRKILSTSYMKSKDWNHKTRYMEVDGKVNHDGLPDSDIYSYRCTLPKLEDVIKKI